LNQLLQAVAVAAPAAGGGDDAPVAEQYKPLSMLLKKLAVLNYSSKLVKDLTGLGLKEAKILLTLHQKKLKLV